MDVLTYDYGSTASNKLLNVSDGGDKTKGFIEPGSTTGNDYTYDVNGNMTVDQNKGITAITYNHLNLPVQVNKGSTDYMIYTYDAGGTLSLGAKPGGRGNGYLLMNLEDESEAYKRQALFDNTNLPNAVSKAITISNIKLIQDNTGAFIYSSVPENQANLPAYTDQAVQERQYKKISEMFQNAFRVNGVTYSPK